MTEYGLDTQLLEWLADLYSELRRKKGWWQKGIEALRHSFARLGVGVGGMVGS